MLKRTRRLGLLLGTVLMLSTLASTTSAGAQEDVEPGDDATVAQVAPSCIERYWHNHSDRKEAHATSFCVGTYYIKFIIAYGPDSGCYRIGPGGGAYWWWQVGWPYAASRLDRLELC